MKSYEKSDKADWKFSHQENYKNERDLLSNWVYVM